MSTLWERTSSVLSIVKPTNLNTYYQLSKFILYISSHCPKTRTSPDFKMFLVDQTHLKSDNIRKST